MSAKTSTTTKVLSVLFIGSILLAAFTGESRDERESRMRAEQIAEAKRFNALPVNEQMDQRLKDLAHQIPLMVSAIKSNLRSPDSFKQEDINVSASKDRKTVQVVIMYRAQNGFGGMNRESVRFTYHWDDTQKKYILI